MCLIVVARHVHPDYPLIVAANRDEFFVRNTTPLERWSERQVREGLVGPGAESMERPGAEQGEGAADDGARPDIPAAIASRGVLAGRDDSAGGTWLAAAPGGRFSAVTNVRDADPGPGRLSRGRLPLHGLAGEIPEDLEGFGPVNLLWGDPDELHWISNRGRASDDPVGAPGDLGPEPVGEGLHALSNASLDTPWPKAQRAVAGVEKALRDWAGPKDGEAGALRAPGTPDSPGTPDVSSASGAPAERGTQTPPWAAALLAPLLSRARAPLADIPRTGVPVVREWFLSAPFVRMPGYGTRCQTALAVSADGAVDIVERTFGPDGIVRHVVIERLAA